MCSPNRDHTGFKFTVAFEMLKPLSWSLKSFMGLRVGLKPSTRVRNTEIQKCSPVPASPAELPQKIKPKLALMPNTSKVE